MLSSCPVSMAEPRRKGLSPEVLEARIEVQLARLNLLAAWTACAVGNHTFFKRPMPWPYDPSGIHLWDESQLPAPTTTRKPIGRESHATTRVGPGFESKPVGSPKARSQPHAGGSPGTPPAGLRTYRGQGEIFERAAIPRARGRCGFAATNLPLEAVFVV
jgi:hypothetical protein